MKDGLKVTSGSIELRLFAQVPCKEIQRVVAMDTSVKMSWLEDGLKLAPQMTLHKKRFSISVSLFWRINFQMFITRNLQKICLFQRKSVRWKFNKCLGSSIAV